MESILSTLIELALSIATTVVYVVGVVELTVRVSPTLRKVLKLK